MNLNIYSKDVDLNADAEGYIRKKARRLERHLRAISATKVEVSRTSSRSQADRIVVQMTVDAGGYTLRGQESAPNLFGAVDAVTNVMDRQLQKYKGKMYRTAQSKKLAKVSAAASNRPGDKQGAEEPLAAEDEALLDIAKVVRTKRFNMRPMAVEDAIDEMELLNHGFFLFYNLDSDQYNVVYRRSDGDYGLIEPELA